MRLHSETNDYINELRRQGSEGKDRCGIHSGCDHGFGKVEFAAPIGAYDLYIYGFAGGKSVVCFLCFVDRLSPSSFSSRSPDHEKIQ